MSLLRCPTSFAPASIPSPARRLTLVLALVALLAAPLAAPAAAQDHDLVLDDATDVTSANPADHLSPDIKVGADFGDTTVPDEVRRGIVNQVFGRFYVNGTQDQTMNSGDVQLLFHWRNATAGETPPDLGAAGAGWQPMTPASLPVTWSPTDPVPFLLITNQWPTNYPSAVGSHVEWTPPSAGDLFHVRVEARYPTGTTDANPGDNVAVSLYDSVAGLKDVDVLIVHDLSGSMLTYTYNGDNYLKHAISRAQAFVASMTESHRVAVVGFGGCLAGNTDDVWPTPGELRPAVLLNKLGAMGAISGLSIPHFGCGTPMGPGLERALQVFASSPSASGHKKAVLLLTDGYDNTGSPRACPGTGADPCLTSPVLANLQNENVRVFSIALGAAAWVDCVECLTDETGGMWYSPAGPGIDLAEVYLHMQQDYSADDLYRVDRGVTGGQDDSYSTFFEGRDDLLYFILQSDRLDAEIGLELRPPGGSWQSASSVAGSRVEQDRGFAVARIENPATGTWDYRVVGEPRQAYLAAVRSDRVGVQLRLDVDSKPWVGSPIHLRARLVQDGRPVRAQRMTATVQAPSASLGNLLRRAGRKVLLDTKRYPVDPDKLRETDLNPRTDFIQQITQGQPHRLGRDRTFQVDLERRDDGTFVGVFERPVNVAGDYTVTVTHRGEKADREMSRTVRLRPRPEIDSRRTFAELVHIEERDSEAKWLLRVYPTDEAGNAITAPELVEELEVEVRGAEPVTKPAFAFDSALEIWLEAGQRRPTLERVTLGGRKVRIDQRPNR